MKQTENNEIDLLLRGLARREGSRSIALEDHSAEHLDADELNSYAEQTLPAAARARYTSHLAECASCRKIVSELTASSGTRAREQSVSENTSAGLWQKLRALLAPGTLRYAVPALALIAFVAVGLVVLRNQTRPEFVASTQPAVAQREAGIETKPAESTVESSTSAATNDRAQFDDFQKNAGKPKGDLAKTGERTETSKTATTTDSLSDADNKDASLAKAARPVAQPSYAPEPAAAPPPKSLPSDTESRTEVAAREKKEADKTKEEPAREQEGARARRDDSQNEVAAAPTGRFGVGQSQAKTRTPDAKPGSVAGVKGNDEEADTRTVSGRRFRRQGGVWIDTAFQSSSATTLLTRGSEQFRALVADEPGIRAIAAQLPGEVVVVWKGRAYRIR